MRVHTESYFDWDTEKWIEVSGYDYEGPLELAKGDASKAEQANADKQREQENALTQQQLALQQQQLASVNAAVDPTIQAILNGQTPGVLQGLEQSLTAGYLNQIPAQFRGIQGQINNALVARGITGGQNAGSGDIARNFGQLGAMQAALQQQGAVNTAQTMNQQKLGLLQNDLGLKMGIANQYGSNVGGFNNAAIGSLNAGVNAAYNADQAATSWMGPVFGGLSSMASGLIAPGGWLGKPK